MQRYGAVYPLDRVVVEFHMYTYEAVCLVTSYVGIRKDCGMHGRMQVLQHRRRQLQQVVGRGSQDGFRNLPSASRF